MTVTALPITGPMIASPAQCAANADAVRAFNPELADRLDALAGRRPLADAVAALRRCEGLALSRAMPRRVRSEVGRARAAMQAGQRSRADVHITHALALIAGGSHEAR